MCLIMSGYDLGIQPNILRPDTNDTAMCTQTYEVCSYEEIEGIVKAAIWRRCNSFDQLSSIQIKEMMPGYKIELTYTSLREVSLQAFGKDNLTINRRIEYGDYRIASTSPLHQKEDLSLQAEVRDVTHSPLPLSAIMKLYHCDLSSLNMVIQEALIQATLSSAYTRKLLDFSIRKGSNHSFEVGLVMERLEGDLESDITRRSQLDNRFTEAELMRILECMTEALLYAKIRVNST